MAICSDSCLPLQMRSCNCQVLSWSVCETTKDRQGRSLSRCRLPCPRDPKCIPRRSLFHERLYDRTFEISKMIISS